MATLSSSSRLVAEYGNQAEVSLATHAGKGTQYLTPQEIIRGGANAPVHTSFRLAVDQREKAPYTFAGLVADASQSNRPLSVTCETHHLETGDYSIVGLTDVVAIERKSLPDLYSTLGQHRDRFKAEHERLAAMAFAAVVIEATLEDVIRRPPPPSRLNPKTVYRTSLAWPVRYGVHWLFCGPRRLAEVTAFRLLQQFHKQWTKRRGDER